MKRWMAGGLLVVLVAMAAPLPAWADIRLVPAYGESALVGPQAARGAVIWSHGRSVESEDSEAPTPLYVKVLRQAGWDVYRLDRLRVSDTLQKSSRALADHADALKGRGYRQVVAAGQSFGAFISLMAAGRTDSVDAVVGTAPAAFGSFTEAYDSYRENATRLWPILDEVRRARVMLFFFHGDDFDPGGRGERARTILTARGLDNVVIDQPALLAGHGASNSGMFVRRFGQCIARFADHPPRADEAQCDDTWGRQPSPDLLQAGLPKVSAGTAAGTEPAKAYVGTWYGTYLNGREVVLSVNPAPGERNAVRAEYMLGPGVESDQAFERVNRLGRITDGELVFDEPGRNVLRYKLRPDGKLTGSWQERSGKSRLETVLRRMQ